MKSYHHQLILEALSTLCVALLLWQQIGVNGLSMPKAPIAIKHQEQINLSRPKPLVKDVCIVGGGPVGLAAAIMLSRPPHNYNCVVFESNANVTDFSPGRGFLYNVNTRGRKFTQLFPSLDELLQINGVKSDFKKFCIIPSNPDEKLPDIAIQAAMEGNDNQKLDKERSASKMVPKGETLNSGIKTIMDSQKEKGGAMKDSYWIQRHEFTRLLRDYCLDYKEVDSEGSVEIITGVKCVDVCPSKEGGSENGGVEVTVENVDSKELTTFTCNLVIGADGYRSKVRDILASEDNLFRKSSAWNHISKGKFVIKKYKSPATHLRIKVFQFPPQFSVRNVDNEYIKTNAAYIYGIRSINKGPKKFISLGILPFKDNNAIRPVNVIARPNHDVWKINDPEELREWFQKAFPRLNFQQDGILPREEWERWINEEGTRFPHCQYTNGVSISSVDQKSSVILVGDSLHSYPPDIGQGINSGLLDVVALGKAIENVDLSVANRDKEASITSLGKAMMEFEKDRLGETKALIRLARFGSPYQYNQPLLKDKIGKKMWTINILIRVLLNKISLGIMPKPAIMLSQDPNLNFRQVMRRADIFTLCLGTCATLVFKHFFWGRLVTLLLI